MSRRRRLGMIHRSHSRFVGIVWFVELLSEGEVYWLPYVLTQWQNIRFGDGWIHFLNSGMEQFWSFFTSQLCNRATKPASGRLIASHVAKASWRNCLEVPGCVFMFTWRLNSLRFTIIDVFDCLVHLRSELRLNDFIENVHLQVVFILGLFRKQRMPR